MSGDHYEGAQYGKPVVFADGDKIHLVCDPICGHLSVMDPEDAWDLGDDLIIAADRLMSEQGKWQEAVTEAPPWMDQVHVAVTGNGLGLVCEDHGIIEYPGMMISLTQAMDGARAHWRQQHSAEVDVAEHAEGEDGHADAQPSVPEAEPDTEAVADAHGGGDQVQNDLDK